MGVKDVLKQNPLEVAYKLVKDPEQKDRINEYQERVDLYQENSERWLQVQVWKLFSQGRRQKIEPFIKLAASVALHRRIVDEISRPVYSPIPQRSIYLKGRKPGKPGERKPSPTANTAYQELSTKLRLDARMDLACRLMNAANCVALHPRMSARLGPVLDVLTPNMFWVVPDPDDPVRELAVIYSQQVRIDGNRTEQIYVYWDDTVAFKFTERGMIMDDAILGSDGERDVPVSMLTEANGHPGILPFVVLHARERWGTYWDRTTGRALVAAHHALGILRAMTLRLHKTQGHQQVAASGNFPRDQLLDEENPIDLGDDGKAEVLIRPTDTTHHLKTADHIALSTAADHGLNRDQMNQMAVELSDATGLLERRGETMRVMRGGEERLLEVLKVVTSGTEWQLPDAAQLAIDYAEISAKADRMQQLAIRSEEISQGVRNYIDNVLEDNPEIATEEEAEAELEHNLEVNAKWVERMRALNQSPQDDMANPGQTAAENGAQGGAEAAAQDSALTADPAQARAGKRPRGNEGAYGQSQETTDGV